MILLFMLWMTAWAQDHGEGAVCAHCHESPHGDTVPEDTGCASCHVDTGWTPSTFDLTRHAATAFPLTGKHTDVACDTCHTQGRLSGQPTECAGCHVDRHRGILGDACTECHSPEGFLPVADFDHDRTGFHVSGAHGSLACGSCHDGANGQGLRQGQGAACTTCHVSSHADFAGAVFLQSGTCTDCHDGDHATFTDARRTRIFDHRATDFHLERRHANLPCASCHPSDGAPAQAECSSCHEDVHMGQLTDTCDSCHRPDRWRLTRFDHDLSSFVLKGRHHVTPCADCHVAQQWVGTPTECWDCHADDAARAPASVPAHAFGGTCEDCHGQWRW